MSASLLPSAGTLIEIDVPGSDGAARTIQRRISTWRHRRGGDYACLLTDPDGGLASAILALSPTGRWSCTAPPVAIQPAPIVRRDRA